MSSESLCYSDRDTQVRCRERQVGQTGSVCIDSGSNICVSGWYVFHIIISYSKYKGPDTGTFLVSFKELIKRVGRDERNKNRSISTITYKVLMILW